QDPEQVTWRVKHIEHLTRSGDKGALSEAQIRLGAEKVILHGGQVHETVHMAPVAVGVRFDGVPSNKVFNGRGQGAAFAILAAPTGAVARTCEKPVSVFKVELSQGDKTRLALFKDMSIEDVQSELTPVAKSDYVLVPTSSPIV